MARELKDIELSEVHKHKSHKDGLCSRCKMCAKQHYEKNRAVLLIYKRKYHEKNRERELAYNKQYRKDNHTKRARYVKDYCKRHPEWSKAQGRKNYHNHKQECLLRVSKYKKKHRSRYNELSRLYVMKRKSLPCTLTGKEWQHILFEHDYCCYYCGCILFGKAIHREHKIPASRGGGYTRENIVPSCVSCNVCKHTLTDVEFLLRQTG
ncbi:hypothetical protein LCGC14_1437300 [marine sediment metagenome]|uniref:HNH nuclease domain-containing protein n=1 Tax=marine sediment metagenome TaxID=412755 RepID=A0A0F9K811_9ZZZZ